MPLFPDKSEEDDSSFEQVPRVEFATAKLSRDETESIHFVLKRAERGINRSPLNEI
jgi:hypothetical protein